MAVTMMVTILQRQLPSTPRKTQLGLTLQKKTQGKGSAKDRKTTKRSRDMDGFNVLMMTIARRKNAELEASKTSGNNVDFIVHLMESWKSA
jgi:hypothetical protein